MAKYLISIRGQETGELVWQRTVDAVEDYPDELKETPGFLPIMSMSAGVGAEVSLCGRPAEGGGGGAYFAAPPHDETGNLRVALLWHIPGLETRLPVPPGGLRAEWKLVA